MDLPLNSQVLGQVVLIWACEYLVPMLELKQSYRVYSYLAMGIAGLNKVSQDKGVFPMIPVDYLCFCIHTVLFAVKMQAREKVTCC